MSDPELTHAFIRQGLVSYPAALDAVDFFETQIRDALRAVFEAKKDWQAFRRAKDASGVDILPTAGKFGVAPNRGLYAYVEGEKRGEDKTWATLGLFWNAPKVKLPVVAYAHFSIGNRVASIDHHPARDPRVSIGSLDAREKRLYLDAGASFDPVPDFSLLLDALDAAIPAATA